jgi:hypothetical protein
MKTKWIFRILIGLMTCSIFSISQGADRLYFGSYEGKEHAYMLKDSLKFNIVCVGWDMDSSDIDSLANGSLRAIVLAPGENSPSYWAWGSHYTLWEAEGFPGSNVNLHYDGGSLVNDDSASGGKSMKFSGPGTPRLIQTGPAYYQEVENYTAEFRLKFLGSLYTSPEAMHMDTPAPVCSVMVMDMASHNILKDKTIYESDFPGGGVGGYQTFTLENYTVPGWNQIEFQIYWYGISGNLYVDYVKVYTYSGKQLMSGVKDSAITAYVSQDWTKTVNVEGDTVIYRWYMRDEPPSIDLYMPTAHIDSLLKQVSQERVGFQAFWRFTRPDEAHEYLLRQDPKDICFDIFPMGELKHDTTGPTYQQIWNSQIIQHLNFTKTVSDSLNKDFWLVPQVYTYADTFKGSCDYYPLIYWNGTSWCPHQRDPSRYELRLQTFLGLCYGADGILYFQYSWWIDGNGNLLTGLYDVLNDSTTYKWREIKDFTGPRVEKLGPILIRLNWQGACVDSSNDRFDLLGCGGGYLDSIRSHNPADEPHWVQVGFFENQAGDTSYFMLVNRECLETEGANYDVFVTKTGGPYQIRDMYSDTIVGNVNGIGDYFTVYLGPGEGKLFRLEAFIRGDANRDGVIDIVDVVHLINYLFIGGPAPEPLEAGDANYDGVVDIVDVVYLINYLFINGPPPCEPPRDSGR